MTAVNPRLVGLRAGSLGGGFVVYDETIQLNENVYVLFYSVTAKGIDVWRRGLARGSYRACSADDPRADTWFEAYSDWRQRAETEVTEKHSIIQRNQSRIIAKHRGYAETYGYLGYRYTRDPVVREPDCLACGHGLSSYGTLECLRCHWVICHSCGACGCGWSGQAAESWVEDCA